MTTSKTPFPVPEQLTPTLLRVMAYWESLKRAGNSMPFWDDLNLSALPDLADRLLVMDVFVNPERFRFKVIGKEFGEGYVGELPGTFADKVALKGPLAYLRSQCSATVEGQVPTFYRSHGTATDAGFSRLLTPMWGDGHIRMLLGAIDRQ